MTRPRLSLSLSRPDALMKGLLLVMMIFVIQLFYLQIIKHGYYTTEANDIQIQPLVIKPERGQIYVRDGDTMAPLVLNERVYTVFVDPSEVKDVTKTVETLRPIIGGNTVGDITELLRDESKKIRYRIIARDISRAQAELINTKQLPGIGLQQTSRRIYPEGNLAAQLLGFVDNDGKGQYGIEGALNDRLRGTPGLLQTVTDVRRIPLTIGARDIDRPAVDGDDLVLTIDRTTQLKAEEVLRQGLEKVKASTGSILIMNPTNGQVIAMANYPTYDPAEYSKVEDYTLFQNRIVSAPYENGSVVKTLVIGAGLDSGSITANSTFRDTTGCTTVEDRSICNIPEDPILARATMQDILTYSLNTGTVYVLRQMGGGEINKKARDTLYRYYHDQFRFGQLTGIEQQGESGGIIISPNEQEGNAVRYSNMVFGQGMNQTMIQTASAFSALINGGTFYQPHVVAGVQYDNGSFATKQPEIIKKNVVSASVSTTVRDMTVQGRKLGGFGRSDKPGYMIGGKTGSSQTIDPKTGKYTEDTIGSYLGFGGVDRPEYVIMVRVDDSKLPGNHGSTAAAPIFNDMNTWMVDHYLTKDIQ